MAVAVARAVGRAAGPWFDTETAGPPGWLELVGVAVVMPLDADVGAAVGRPTAVLSPVGVNAGGVTGFPTTMTVVAGRGEGVGEAEGVGLAGSGVDVGASVAADVGEDVGGAVGLGQVAADEIGTAADPRGDWMIVSKKPVPTLTDRMSATRTSADFCIPMYRRPVRIG